MTKEEIEALSLEESIKRLEETASRMETNAEGLTLEQLMGLYQEGALLSAHATAMLSKAQQEIEVMEKRFNQEGQVNP